MSNFILKLISLEHTKTTGIGGLCRIYYSVLFITLLPDIHIPDPGRIDLICAAVCVKVQIQAVQLLLRHQPCHVHGRRLTRL